MSQKTAVAEPDTLEYRLPRIAVPQRYEIKLAPDLQVHTFTGEVEITLEMMEPSQKILLNAADLEIHAATASGAKQLQATWTLDQERERVVLEFPEQLSKGAWKLSLKFTGTLNDKLRGFYKSTYTGPEGESKTMAVTQFEATDARRAFPCFDEPDFKAVFKVRLVVDEKLQALSNARIVAERGLAGGKKEVEFADTIKMSTYLVAFIVGELECTEAAMAGKTPVRVWCVPGKKHLTGFAISSGVHSLNFFEKYYGVAYAGDKLDLIAIPDFAFGAMENLGCVTFRETALLVDEKSASHAELERIADVVAHEIAHMWFGDLTTMSWWNGIWLNEAFATFAEMLAVDDFKPEWQRWNTFGVSRAAAFITDGLKSTRPIEFVVRHAHECEGMFDVLTYEKGASVLRMLEQFLGEDVFRKGISHYLSKHQFANTETSDLWDAIEQVSKEPVRAMMDSWIFQKGHPVVSAELDSSGAKLTLSQKRFFYLPEEAEQQLFHVPLLIDVYYPGSEKRESRKLLLTEEQTTIDLGKAAECVIVNAGGHGFFRVRYSKDLLFRLTAKLFRRLSAIERFNLVNDTWASTVAGYTSPSEYLEMLPLFQDESDKNVWAVITSSLAYLERILDESDRPKLQAFTTRLLRPVLERLGWEPAAGEDQLTRQMRATIIATAGTTGASAEVQKKAEAFYQKHKKDPSSVDPNLLPALVSILAYTGDADRYAEFAHAWMEGKTPQEEERYLYALAAFKKKDLLAETLRKATSPEVRTQNAPYLLRAVMMNVDGRTLAWEHMKKNWDYITAKFPNNSLPRMLEGITALVGRDLESDVDKFLAENPPKHGAKTIEQHRERLRVATRFKERQARALVAALE